MRLHRPWRLRMVLLGVLLVFAATAVRTGPAAAREEGGSQRYPRYANPDGTFNCVQGCGLLELCC